VAKGSKAAADTGVSPGLRPAYVHCQRSRQHVQLTDFVNHIRVGRADTYCQLDPAAERRCEAAARDRHFFDAHAVERSGAEQPAIDQPDQRHERQRHGLTEPLRRRGLRHNDGRTQRAANMRLRFGIGGVPLHSQSACRCAE
jgi:hypothetical protein